MDEREILAPPGGKKIGCEFHGARSIVALEIGGPVMNIRHRVELKRGERAQPTAMLSGGKHAARKLKRAQILLAADAGIGDEAIADSISVGGSTFTGPNGASWKATLISHWSEEARPGAARKLSCKETCRWWWRRSARTHPKAVSAGRSICWPGQMVQLTEHEGLSRETVRRRLAEDDLKPWPTRCGAFRK